LISFKNEEFLEEKEIERVSN